jgi:hypothetical protein
MTLSAPTQLDRRGRRPAEATHHDRARPAGLQRAVVPFPAKQVAPAQSVVMVDFASPDGRRWWAVGVGDTLAEALAFAQDSCPADATWQPTNWNDLYGD